MGGGHQTHGPRVDHQMEVSPVVARTLLSFLALVPVAHLKEGEGQDCKTLKVRAVQAL
jgi:hypothetical protein